MLFATFNVNSIRARMQILIPWMDKVRPDVLCLQETKVQDHQFPEAEFTEIGYHVAYRGQKSYNGVAIATLSKPTSVSFGLDDGEDFADETRLAAMEVDGIHVVNTYIPQGHLLDSPKFAYKMRWYQRLKDYFDRHYSPDDLLLWTGDLNVAPTPIDLHDPRGNKDHVCFHESVRERFAEVAAWGFQDVFRKHRPEPLQYSFYDYRVKGSLERAAGWRIDLPMATASLAQHSVEAWIDLEPRRQERPSDHTPVLVRFDL